MPARRVCLVTLSLSKDGPGRFGRQQSSPDFYHTTPYHIIPCRLAKAVIVTGYLRCAYGFCVRVTAGAAWQGAMANGTSGSDALAEMTRLVDRLFDANNSTSCTR